MMSLTKLDEYFKNLGQLRENVARVAEVGKRSVKGQSIEWHNVTLRGSLEDMVSTSTNFTEERKEELLVEIQALKALV